MNRNLVAAAFVAAFFHATPVFAAPPSSCAGKFVGTWSYPGGTTRVNADGTAHPKCPMCVGVQTWTCSGNTYIITSPTSYSATLSPDGRRLVGGSITAVRVGGTPKVAAPAKPAGGSAQAANTSQTKTSQTKTSETKTAPAAPSALAGFPCLVAAEASGRAAKAEVDVITDPKQGGPYLALIHPQRAPLEPIWETLEDCLDDEYRAEAKLVEKAEPQFWAWSKAGSSGTDWCATTDRDVNRLGGSHPRYKDYFGILVRCPRGHKEFPPRYFWVQQRD